MSRPGFPRRRRGLPPLGTLALALAMAVGLSGCGKKPKVLDPPQGWDANTFPRNYPSPEDGKPVIRSKPESGPNTGAPNAGSDGKNDGYDGIFPGNRANNPSYGGTLTNPSNLPYSSSGGSSSQ